MKRTRRMIVFAAGGAAVALLLALAVRPGAEAVDAAEVVRGPLRTTIDADGVTRVRDRYVIAAPVAGRLLRMPLRQGDVVEAGAEVARIAGSPLDPRTVAQAEARLAAARAAQEEAATAIRQLQALVSQARREARRTHALADAGAVSESAREQADLEVATRARDLEAALARKRAAAAEARAAAAALEGAAVEGAPAALTPVRAPAAGRVLRVLQESETPVAPGQPILEVGDAHALEAVVDVLSTDAVRVAPGMPVVVEGWGGDTALTGRVRTVAPGAFTRLSALGVEEQRVNVAVDLDRHPPALGDGYRVEARIVSWQSDDVLKVPLAALLREGDGWYAFAIENGRAARRRVELGARGEEEAQVRSGLAEGERVIRYPSDRIADGVRVRAP